MNSTDTGTEIDVTVIESADGRHYAISLRDNDTLVISDCTGLDSLEGATPVGTWSFEALRTVQFGLALDLNRGMFIDPIRTAMMLQWANII